MKVTNAPITVGGTTVTPGRRTTLEIPVARLPTDTYLSLPVAIVNGRNPGPTIWLSGAVHGDEINGVEIIRELLPMLNPRTMAGAVIAVPIVNVFGFISGSRYLPDRRDLNRSFPGSPRGSLASRLAHLFLTEVVDRCHYGIDLHTATDHRTNLPQIRANLEDAAALEVARAFGTRVIVNSPFRDGSLREVASRRGIHTLVYEAGEAHRFDGFAVREGVAGVLRVLHHLGIRELAADDPAPPIPQSIEVYSSSWVRARRSGILRLDCDLGEVVEKGQEIGRIADAFGKEGVRIRAVASGMVIGMSRNPLCSQGDALIHIADISGAHVGRTAGPAYRGGSPKSR